MNFLILSLISFFAASAIAADCSNPAGSLPGELLHAYWDARNQMCSNSGCPYQQDCQVPVTASDANGNLTVVLKRSKAPAVQGFSNCYDATNNIINQCIYDTHFMSGTWEYGGETYELDSTFVPTPPPPPPSPPPAAPAPAPAPASPNTCNVSKYCSYTYNNNNCGITTWNCDTCAVAVFWECISGATCSSGAQCINGLCCHADKLANGSSDCPTTNDLQLCGGYYRVVGVGSEASWVPPDTDIPSNLKCGC